jgi:parallel beta-helix repeat protein
MEKKTASAIMLTLLLTGMLTLAFNIQPVKASGTIYIRADGSIDPPTAPISTVDNVTYTFTDNIYDPIVVERNNIVIDGNGYTLQGAGTGTGIYLSGGENVTVRNTQIKAFRYGIVLSGSSNNSINGNTITNNGDGIYLDGSSNNNSISGNTITNNGDGIYLDGSSNNNSISGNTITNNWYGIVLSGSSNNSISGNNITANNWDGIVLSGSSNNSISGNTITNNGNGISLGSSSNYNSISGNNIVNNGFYGIYLDGSSNNKFYHNNFINNGVQVYSEDSANVWDDGYPSGGNYWSDYTALDQKCGPSQDHPGSDGMGDTPYVIDSNNRDNYPLMNPWTPPAGHNIAVVSVVSSKTVICQGFSGNVTVYAANRGEYSETFNVTVYANTTTVETKEITLESGNSTTIAFTWNTTGFAKGNYTISAYAEPVPGEELTNTLNNNFTDGWIIVSMVGDINGPDGWPDGKVDMIYDIRSVAKGFGANLVTDPASPKYGQYWHSVPCSECPHSPNYDINGDGVIDMIYDIRTVAKQFGKTDP